jgi:hypothetical protein
VHYFITPYFKSCKQFNIYHFVYQRLTLRSRSCMSVRLKRRFCFKHENATKQLLLHYNTRQTITNHAKMDNKIITTSNHDYVYYIFKSKIQISELENRKTTTRTRIPLFIYRYLYFAVIPWYTEEYGYCSRNILRQKDEMSKRRLTWWR